MKTNVTIHTLVFVIYLEHSAKLLNTFRDQLLMQQHFSALHDPHNTSINRIASILINIFNYFLPFIYWRWRNRDLFHKQSLEAFLFWSGNNSSCYIYLDSPHCTGELGVELENIRCRDALWGWFLVKNPVLCAWEREKHPYKIFMAEV